MTMTWVTWVTAWSVVALLIIAVGQWVHFKLAERRGAREFARRLDEHQPWQQLQDMDDEAFWAAIAKEPPREQ